MRHFRSVLIPAVLFLLPGIASAGWVQQPSGTTAGLGNVCFVDVQNGWVGSDNGFLLHTSDRGTHWDRVIVDSALQFISALWFRDTSYGWVCGSKELGFLGELYTTSDGGAHWRSLKRDSVQCYFDVEFVTPLKGWLVSSILYSNGGGKGYLYYTSDGGASWAINDSSRPPQYGIYWDISFADSLNGYLAVGNPGVTESYGYLQQTTDGGLSWQGSGSGLTMYRRVHCLDRDHVWDSWYWYWSNNRMWGVSCGQGGMTGPGYRTPPFAPVDTLRGWVLFPDTLFDTRDGGITWARQVLPGIKYDICFTDSLNGWIVGYNGLILHTTDGGSGVFEEPSHSRLVPCTSRLTVSPNPFSSFASVLGHERDRFVLYDISGRRVGTYKGDRIGEGLRAGVYFIRAESGDARPVRVVKLR